MLQELDFADGEHDQPNASLNKSSKKHRSHRKKRRKVDDGTIEEEVTEKSNEDEDERREKEIERKTMANVLDYDEWLEAKT